MPVLTYCVPLPQKAELRLGLLCDLIVPQYGKPLLANVSQTISSQSPSNGTHQSCQSIALYLFDGINQQVDNVQLLSRGIPTVGTVHLTAHHLIFSANVAEGQKPREMWVCYPMIHTVERRQPLSLGVEGCALRFRCRDFNFFTLGFRNEAEGKDVFESIQKLTCVGIHDLEGRVNVQPRRVSCTRSFTILGEPKGSSIHGVSINLQRNLRGWDWELKRMNGG